MKTSKHIGINTRTCELCLFDGIERYEKAYLNNEMPKSQIVSELANSGVEINNYRWWKHITQHVMPAITQTAMKLAPDIAEDIVDSLTELGGSIDRLKEKAETMFEDIKDENDPQMIKAWVSLEQALGQTIERVDRVTNNMKGIMNVKQQNIKFEFNNFAGKILQDACPVCKAKFAETLGELVKKDEKLS